MRKLMLAAAACLLFHSTSRAAAAPPAAKIEQSQVDRLAGAFKAALTPEEIARLDDCYGRIDAAAQAPRPNLLTGYVSPARGGADVWAYASADGIVFGCTVPSPRPAPEINYTFGVRDQNIVDAGFQIVGESAPYYSKRTGDLIDKTVMARKDLDSDPKKKLILAVVDEPAIKLALESALGRKNPDPASLRPDTTARFQAAAAAHAEERLKEIAAKLNP